MKKSKVTRSLLAACSIVALSAVMYGCVHSGDDPEPPVVEPEPTAYDAALAAINAATTAADAQAAYDAVDQAAVSGDEDRKLQAALASRLEAFATMDREAAQKMALMTAAGNIDTSDLSTAAAIAAANAAIAALEVAIAAAVDVDDTSMYQAQVTAAKTAVAAAQSSLDHAAQTAALSAAVAALQAIDLTVLSTQANIDAADAAIAAVRSALAAATELSAAEKTIAMTELATADRAVMMAQGRFDTAAQKTALAEAVATLAALDLDNLMTQEQIDAAVAAITGVRLALDAATNLTDAEKLDATVDVTVAQRKVDRAETDLASNVEGQRMALMTAGTALAALDLDDLSDQAKIDAAQAAVDALKAALDAATHLSDSEKAMYQTQLDTATETVKTAQTGMDRDERRTAQMEGLTTASGALNTALEALSGDEAPTQAQIDAAETALAALNTAIEGAGDLTDAEKADAMRAVAVAEGRIAGAKQARMVADAAKAEEERKAREAAMAAMAVMAAELYKGIGAPTAAATDDPARHAAYGTGDDANKIVVTYGPSASTTTGTLSVDEDEMVAASHGWTGMMFTAAPENGGTYEARVYSHVGDPTEGAMFSATYAYDVTPVDGDNTELNITGGTAVAERIASSSFDQSAGVKEFALGNNMVRVMIAGSYHGVPGTYNCTPAASSTCAVEVAADGFNLGGTADADNAFTAGGGTWTFKANNADTRLMDVPDDEYASYGWWVHKAEDDGAPTASAFHAYRGTAPTVDIAALNGTATYMGGAAGKYALQSSTGGTNDAGHFTADAMLTATFAADHTISGTISNFTGADGMARDWSVELMKSTVADGGAIAGDPDTTGNTDAQMTVWTIGGTAADAAGQWSGNLHEEGDDGVPALATGTFYSEYGRAGKMVGAFGANNE